MMIFRAPEPSPADFMSFSLVSPCVVLVQPSCRDARREHLSRIAGPAPRPPGCKPTVNFLLVCGPRFADNRAAMKVIFFPGLLAFSVWTIVATEVHKSVRAPSSE